jgi:hemolysin D
LTLTRNRGADVDRWAIAQEAAEADEVAATIATLEASLSFVQQEAEVRRKATKIELGNRVAYLEAEGKFLDESPRCRSVTS